MTYQLSVSGETVLRLFFALIHVLQDAFSSRAELPPKPSLLEMMCFQDDQMSSSFQS